MPKANDIFKEAKRLLEAREKRTTCTVGKIVRLPDGKTAIMVNGKPEGEVAIDDVAGVRRITIEYLGKKLVIYPSGRGGKLTEDDVQKMKEDISDIYFGEPPLYFGVNNTPEEIEDSIERHRPSGEAYLKQGEKLLDTREFTYYEDMLEYLNDLTGKDFSDAGWDYPDPDNYGVFMLVDDEEKPIQARVKDKLVEFQGLDDGDDTMKLYVIQVKEDNVQGSLI